MVDSIAIVMDAVNNLSDAASSVITIVGTKLAAPVVAAVAVQVKLVLGRYVKRIGEKVRAEYPEYALRVAMDMDFSE